MLLNASYCSAFAGGCKEVIMLVSNDPGFLCDHNVTAFYYSLLRSWQWLIVMMTVMTQVMTKSEAMNEEAGTRRVTASAEEIKKCLNPARGKRVRDLRTPQLFSPFLLSSCKCSVFCLRSTHWPLFVNVAAGHLVIMKWSCNQLILIKSGVSPIPL